jgi:transcriptional antiterminator RfaH
VNTGWHSYKFVTGISDGGSLPTFLMALPFPDIGWFATQVRATTEQHVAELLKGRGYETFVPLMRRRRRWSDRTVVDWQPMFAGYVFCSSTGIPMARINSTPGVIRIVGFGKEPAQIPSAEIEAIRCAALSGRDVEPASFFQPGQMVRVHSGALSGIEGRLSTIKGSNRLVLSVSLLQRAVAVEIESDLVEPIRFTSERSRHAT